MDQLIFASLSHTHYWYEVDMLKVPAVEGKNKPVYSMQFYSPSYSPIQKLLDAFRFFHDSSTRRSRCFRIFSLNNLKYRMFHQYNIATFLVFETMTLID